MPLNDCFPKLCHSAALIFNFSIHSLLALATEDEFLYTICGGYVVVEWSIGGCVDDYRHSLMYQFLSADFMMMS